MPLDVNELRREKKNPKKPEKKLSVLVVVCFIFLKTISSHTFREDFQFDEHIFQRGWFNHQLVSVG